jgi:transposase
MGVGGVEPDGTAVTMRSASPGPGMSVVEVADLFGMSRQAVRHRPTRYRNEGLAGLRSRSHQLNSCPLQASPEVKAASCELRRKHPRWGCKQTYTRAARAAERRP